METFVLCASCGAQRANSLDRCPSCDSRRVSTKSMKRLEEWSEIEETQRGQGSASAKVQTDKDRS